MSITVDIKLSKPNKIYNEGVGNKKKTLNEKHRLSIHKFQDILAGVIQINCSNETKHDGINISAEGTVNLLMSNKNVGLFEAFSNSVKVGRMSYGLTL